MANDKKPVPGGQANGKVANKQSQLMIGVAVIVIVLFGGISIYMNKPKDEPEIGPPGASVRMKDAVGRSPSDVEAFTQLNNEVQGLQGAFEGMQKSQQDVSGKLTAIERLLMEEQNADDNDSAELNRLMARIDQLEQRLQEQGGRESLPRNAMPRSGQAGRTGVSYQTPPSIAGSQGRQGRLSGTSVRRSQQVITISSEAGQETVEAFEEDVNGDLSEAKEPQVFATENYVPPNAYAPAKVYVGVDAATGKKAQADPQAAAFIITGPARHVVVDGQIQETDLTGCIVNGAAQGDLSTERVFIKLQKMTCPLPDGRVSVAQVEGHVTQSGKAGVRGRIVSRVGDQLNKAAIASGLSGLGDAFGTVGRSGVGVGGGGALVQEIPDADELAIAGGASAVSGAADTLADYYVDQAKAIQPVVSMPTGVDVELVFINGFLARPNPKEVGE